jgi:hypothetical protein
MTLALRSEFRGSSRLFPSRHRDDRNLNAAAKAASTCRASSPAEDFALWLRGKAQMSDYATKIDTEAARQGVTGHGVRWVLTASCALAVVIMLVLISAS